jgi:hypothetical protein
VGFGKLPKKKKKSKKKQKKKKKDTLDLTMCPKLGLLGSSFTQTGVEMRSQYETSMYTGGKKKKQGTKK